MMVLEKINIILHLVLCRKSLVKGKLILDGRIVCENV